MFLHLQLSLINTTLDGAAYSGKTTKIRVKTDMLFLSACSPGYLYQVLHNLEFRIACDQHGSVVNRAGKSKTVCIGNRI